MHPRFRIFAAIVLAIGLAPATATAAPSDIAATHAYIQANFALASASVARIGPGQTQIESLNGKLASECPGIGAGSLEDEASQPMSYEVAAALWSIAYGADAGPIRTFRNAVGRLHWSKRAITRVAQTYARSLYEMATLPRPDLCREVRAWKASGFQSIPASTSSLVNHVKAIELNAVPSRMLAPYERGSDARTLARTLPLETRVEEQEFTVGQMDWFQLLGTLGLQQ